MTKENILSGLVGILIGLVLAILLASPFASPWRGMMGGGNFMMGGGRMMGSIDSHFIEQMIPHHEDAIAMADIALEKANHEEIKQLARDIQQSQSAEIESMKTWYQDWYGKGVPDAFLNSGYGMGSGMMNMGMMGDVSDVDQLRSAKDFDKAFIEEMIPHHQMAVMMAQMLEQGTERTEMKQLARDIIEAQTREINMMRDWYGEWYGQK